MKLPRKRLLRAPETARFRPESLEGVPQDPRVQKPMQRLSRLLMRAKGSFSDSRRFMRCLRSQGRAALLGEPSETGSVVSAPQAFAKEGVPCRSSTSNA